MQVAAAGRSKRRQPSPVAAARSKRKTRLRTLIVLAAVLVIELIAAAYTSPALGINRIAIRGLDGLPEPEASLIHQAVAVRPGCNLLRVPVRQMERKMKSLPWVDSASIVWLSPHSLGVRCIPRLPVAVATISGKSYEVDSIAIPIRVARFDMQERLTTIDCAKDLDVRLGSPIRDESLQSAIDIYRDAPSQPVVHIDKIVIDHGGNLCLNMVDGIHVELGQPEDLSAKMKFVERVYRLEPRVSNRITAINLAVRNQPACRLKTDSPEATTVSTEWKPKMDPEGTESKAAM